MDTIADVDRRLLIASEAYHQAIDAGQHDTADLCQIRKDALLDLRLHQPADHG